MLTVCNFHYIRTNFESAYPSIFGVKPKDFENQLLMLGKTGEFISQQRLISETNEILRSKQNYILITFDDGFKEQFELAKPILDHYKIPSVYYINSINYIEKEVSLVHKNHLLRSKFSALDLLKKINLFFPNIDFKLSEFEIAKAKSHYKYDEDDSIHLKYLLNFKLTIEQTKLIINALFDEFFDTSEVVSNLYMTCEQLEELSRLNMLGNHTHSHFALGLLPSDKIYNEILKTKNFIDNFGDKHEHTLSYPYGSFEACQNPVESIAKTIGYKIGFTMEEGVNTLEANTLLLKRFDCNDLIGGKNYKQ